ncbi:lipase-like PAD4 isoform X3 [Pyrus x bretschneideri]|uniref:lipase-like PAD4 isoform X3 n=1 Tax=Pyrus x bretschneideri TaxID=225117 RepID=UPI00202E6D67|nr:lipase-like PAD4 isoform X3 [Pyrus x bretschneideri]
MYVYMYSNSIQTLAGHFKDPKRRKIRKEELLASQSMDAEASPFESSETVASFLASTPLLIESWRLCSVANTTPGAAFVSHQIGDVGYFALSGEEDQCLSFRNLVALENAGHGLFPPLSNNNNNNHNNIINGEEEAVMVHAGLLKLFVSLRCSQTFQDQMSALTEKSKSIVITGHSIGGTTASLCALWLLSSLQSVSSTPSVLCITFGSPLLGNASLSRAILRERWGGNFFHVVSKYDIMPRLLLAPIESCSAQVLHFLLQCFQHFRNLGVHVQLRDEEKAALSSFVSAYLRASSLQEGEERESSSNMSYCPFGSYLFCSQEGAVCVENAVSVMTMMHLMFMPAEANPMCCIQDHLNYGDYVDKISSQFLKTSFMQQDELPESSYEAGVALALQSLGINSHEPAAAPAKECLKIARRLGRTPSLNCANLAVRLSKYTPHRAEIEWYMASCDESGEQLGYYDAFKHRGSSKKGNRVNMNRLMLAAFWDGVIKMMETNELPHDFHRRAKWVNASQFYMLLVEPLDIAEYYRTGMHHVKGHYLAHGRERRFEIFDRWWKERSINDQKQSRSRSKFAGLTQDSCFWAKVEEAREWLTNFRSETDTRKLHSLWESINNFDSYAAGLVQRKEVSKDVMAKNSSYMKWLQELADLRSQHY